MLQDTMLRPTFLLSFVFVAVNCGVAGVAQAGELGVTSYAAPGFFRGADHWEVMGLSADAGAVAGPSYTHPLPSIGWLNADPAVILHFPGLGNVAPGAAAGLDADNYPCCGVTEPSAVPADPLVAGAIGGMYPEGSGQAPNLADITGRNIFAGTVDMRQVYPDEWVYTSGADLLIADAAIPEPRSLLLLAAGLAGLAWFHRRRGRTSAA